MAIAEDSTEESGLDDTALNGLEAISKGAKLERTLADDCDAAAVKAL